jgi:diacylglycerol kinase family enzyme
MKSKILVIINPNSGSHSSNKIFNKYKSKLLEKYEITIFLSQYPKHVLSYFNINHQEIIETYDIIVGIGGDGIIFEIINSMQKWNIKCPLAEIPCGSGNGYFKSLTNECNLKNNIDTSIDIILSNQKKNVDLMFIKNLNLCCRLAISWGIISDIDIRTEWMRKIGKIRFDLGAVWYVLRKHSYQGTLTYETIDSKETVQGNFVYFWACNASHGSSDCYSAPGAKLDDGWIYISYVLNNVSRIELAKIALSLSSGEFIKHPKVHYIKTKSFILETKNGLMVIDGEPIPNEKIIHVENLSHQMEILYPKIIDKS